MFCARNVMLTHFLKYLFIFIVSVKYVNLQQPQFTSPCPRLFIYDVKSNEAGKWYGIITLLSDTDLNGVWLRIILDQQSIQLGNWFGQVTSTDNKEFLIKNRNFALKAHTPHALRFYIKYNTSEPTPQLISFRLNGKTYCPEVAAQSNPELTAELQTSGSNIQQPTPSPVKPPVSSTGGGTINGIPGGFHPVSSNTDDDGVYPGDFYKPSQEDILHPSSGDVSYKDLDCGTIKVAFKSETQATVEGQFPWHAALYYVKGIDIVYICGASLISKDHVISAAHCLTKKQSKATLNPENFMIYLGKQFLRGWSNNGIQDRQVSLITIHQNYNPQTLDNDLGIVKLIQSADITDYVRPICLWPDSGDITSITTKQGSLTGWGHDEAAKLTDQLIQAKLIPVSSTACSSSYQTSSIRFNSKTMYCAGFGNGTSKCVGNSGSGMAILNSKSNKEPAVWQLRGVVALSAALQGRVKCDMSQYVVFVDVAKYLDWIKQAMMKVI